MWLLRSDVESWGCEPAAWAPFRVLYRRSSTLPVSTPAGDVSFAVVRANTPCEDRSEVECGKFGTLAGVYDGHGGAMASQFVNDNMYPSLMGKCRLACCCCCCCLMTMCTGQSP